VIDGPINGEALLLYIWKILAPILSPGIVVVLDNLHSHKGKAAGAIVRAKGVGGQGSNTIVRPSGAMAVGRNRPELRRGGSGAHQPTIASRRQGKLRLVANTNQTEPIRQIPYKNPEKQEPAAHPPQKSSHGTKTPRRLHRPMTVEWIPPVARFTINESRPIG